MDKAAFGLTLLRGEPNGPPLPRERALIAVCNRLAGGQVVHAFPGAQPTSLTRAKVGEHLIKEPYLVCEKTDGERHLLLAYEGRTFLIDRKCLVWMCPIQLPLPTGHHLAPGWHHETLLDGELVMDRIPSKVEGQPAQLRLRYLAYDSISFCGEDVTHRTLLYRLRRTLHDVVLPKEQLVALSPRHSESVELCLKDFFEIWQMRQVIELAEQLPHRSDGLVFTPVCVPYRVGTCPSLLKWKPSHLNTVDFMLQVVKGIGRHVHVKLMVGIKKGNSWGISFQGQWLAKAGGEFKALLQDPDKYHGRIGECRWQPAAKTFRPEEGTRFTMEGTWESGGWVLQKIREDKQQPNDMRTAKRVVESIDDDLSLEVLESQILEARQAGTLRIAADCGEGELPRAKARTQDGGAPRRVGWARPESDAGYFHMFARF
eukprot:TRINITY_DN55365_c0_g1_i1.p1 TRINITY_DN55365_c0_g1~~TRINITY_DN55365_c0_g1_i1.p1  ORF type:complete len:429 (+),score=59.17 TRINITY_DN55365_c0_g1_i1:41-1327(+)